MKDVALLLLFFLVIDLSPQERPEISLSNEKPHDLNVKEFLLNYYEETHDQLLSEVSGMNEEQMHYKESPEIWSVSQNLEHIVLTEKAIFSMVQELLAKPANPEKREEVTMSDEEIIAQMTDRSFKAQASDDLQPEGIYDRPEEALSDFESQRSEILSFIKNSEVDFRDYVSESPFGTVNAYQNFLFLAGHTSRHTLQIEEIKAAPGFPD